MSVPEFATCVVNALTVRSIDASYIFPLGESSACLFYKIIYIRELRVSYLASTFTKQLSLASPHSVSLKKYNHLFQTMRGKF